jgi:hypothetical protein
MSKELILAPAIATPDTVEMLPGAETIKNALIARADAIVITRNSTPEVRDQAIAISGEIAAHIKKIDKDDEAIFKPFYDIWKKGKELIKAHCDPLKARKRTLDLGIGAVNDRLAAEHLARQQELLRQQQQAEKDRLATIARQQELELAATPRGKKAAAALLAKQLDAQEEADSAEEAQRKLDQQRIDEAELRRQSAPQTGAGAQRTEIEITVTDIHALYAARRDCVTLKPDKIQLKYLIANNPELFPLPGVTFVKRSVFSSKAR